MPAPEQVEGPRLLARDFDETDARTFAPSPNNINVERSCELSIHDRFGMDALLMYRAQGGLQNRAPSEVVASLFPSSDPEQQKADTEAFIETKLECLMGEIGVQSDGTIWPQPMPGFKLFWEKVQQAKEDGHNITTATVSSGHTEFIRKVFALWDVPTSDILITDDTLRGLPEGCMARNAVKPSPYLIQLVWARWQAMQGNMNGDYMRKNTLYMGDDAIKDGGLARNSGVQFVHMNPEMPAGAWFEALRWLGLAELSVKEALASAQ